MLPLAAPDEEAVEDVEPVASGSPDPPQAASKPVASTTVVSRRGIEDIKTPRSYAASAVGEQSHRGGGLAVRGVNDIRAGLLPSVTR